MPAPEASRTIDDLLARARVFQGDYTPSASKPPENA